MAESWPTNWEQQKAGVGCPFCAEGRPESNEYGIRIFEGDSLDAYLQRRAPLPGYTIAVWRGRHVPGPVELRDHEVASYAAELVRVARALQTHFKPAQATFLTLDLMIPHLHTNIVLRYLDDGSPGRPIAMTGDPIPSKQLDADVDALRTLLS